MDITPEEFKKQVRVDDEGIVTLKVSYEEFTKLSWALEVTKDYYADKEHQDPERLLTHKSEEFKELSEKLDDQVYIPQPKSKGSMSQVKLVTERKDLQPQEYFLEPGFLLFNMGPTEGIWLVDKKHPQYAEIKNTATGVAKVFGDKKSLEKYASEEYQ
jgi:hypothetical protein